jgi:hypothetical protein
VDTTSLEQASDYRNLVLFSFYQGLIDGTLKPGDIADDDPAFYLHKCTVCYILFAEEAAQENMSRTDTSGRPMKRQMEHDKNKDNPEKVHYRDLTTNQHAMAAIMFMYGAEKSLSRAINKTVLPHYNKTYRERGIKEQWFRDYTMLGGLFTAILSRRNDPSEDFFCPQVVGKAVRLSEPAYYSAQYKSFPQDLMITEARPRLLENDEVWEIEVQKQAAKAANSSRALPRDEEGETEFSG